MTVFITYAPQDAAAAESLERFLERRGLFVELETGERGFRPLQFTDVVVVLHSKDSVFSTQRLMVEKRALDAWAEQKLIFVKLDHNFAPVGLRDLPFVDASFEQQRDLVAWAEVHKQVVEKSRPPAPASAAPPSPADDAASQAPPARERSAPQAPLRKARAQGGLWGWLIPLVLLLPGLAASALIGSIWLANRIGPEPGTMRDTLDGVAAFGARFGLSANASVVLVFAALALSALALVVLLFRALTGLERARAAPKPAAPPRAEAPASEAEEAPEPEAVFISYARANSQLVLPVVAEVQREGRHLWLDQENIQGGDGWAGTIVRAIRSAEGVCVMCSAAAFESDHVKREVYLADRYKKRLLPVFIEDAKPPEDFEYFFAGVQALNLFNTPEGERAAALSHALGAAT